MTAPRPSPTVLLIEDGQDARWLWRMMLDGDHRFGRVSEADSTREALDRFRREWFDMVIIDVPVPGRSGLAVVDFLRSRRPKPIVVAVSTRTDVADLAVGHGATEFWAKADLLSPTMSDRLWTLWKDSAITARSTPHPTTSLT